MLWFGDERGYNATASSERSILEGLWFGDERGYNATVESGELRPLRCGLVMKEDITQLSESKGRNTWVVVW